MRVLPLMMIAGYSRFSYYSTINYKKIYLPVNYNNSLPNNIFTPANFNKKKRTFQMLINKYNNRGFNKCYFCDGTGYVHCNTCKNINCYTCENTGYKPCHICGGTGRGGPRPFAIKSFYDEKYLSL